VRSRLIIEESKTNAGSQRPSYNPSSASTRSQRIMAELSIESSVSEDVVRLAVAGDIDMSSSGELRDAIRQSLATAGIRQVIIDLDHVPFLDSTGVRTLLDGYLAATGYGKAFLVSNPQVLVRRVLAISGVLDLLTDGS
jgi:anti-sigma B factor antagonist